MTNDLWRWLAIYYCIGVVLVFIGRQLVKVFHKDNRSDFVKSALAALEEDKTPQQKRREFFKSVATGSLILIVWPVAFAVLINELKKKPHVVSIEDDAPKFTSEKKDLIEIVNPHEVEAAAKVIDPKKRVSELPFGHLNSGWKNLRKQMNPGDVMWSFKTSGYLPKNFGEHKGPQYESPRNIIQGFALVRGRKIVGEFLTQWD